MTEIQKRLFALQDKDYRAFTVKLSPTVDPDSVIGVRLPAIRKLAKELKGSDQTAKLFAKLPHQYFEEYMLHSILLYELKEFDEAINAVERFLPYIDNWAVCDTTRVKAFNRQPEKLLPYIDKWLASGHTYTIRFGILCLMNLFLDERFDTAYADMVAAIRSEEYYVNMMIAWYFATALAKQYDAAVKYIEQNRLDQWTHNKAIQKAVESYRVTDEHKAYLKTLRRKA